MNISLNIIKNILKLYVDNNKIIKNFYYGDIQKLTNENSSFEYPLLGVVPTGSSINKVETRFNSITYNFNIICADLVNGDESNVDDILSDTVQNLSDLVSFLDQNEYFNEYDINLNGTTITMTSFFERFSDVVAGHTCLLSIEVPWKYIDCEIPMIDFNYKNLNC